MNIEYTNPEQFISTQAPGLSIYGDWKENEEDPFETAIFIQEENKFINKLSKYPKVHIKAGLIFYENIGLVVVQVLINNNYDMLYEFFINYWQSGGGKQYFSNLANQDRIMLFFYRGHERKRNIQVENQLKDGFKSFMIELLKYSPWSTEDFDKAKEKLYADFPKPVDLWRKLEESDFSIFN